MMDRPILGWLQGDTPNVQGEKFPLQRSEIIIGRGSKSDVQLADPKISRKHARLRIGGGRFLLEDLDSAHGTLVNGERGDFFVLSDGDVIALGETLLVFRSSPDAVSTVMAPGIGPSVDRYPAVQPPGASPPASEMIPAPEEAQRSPALIFLLGLIPALLIGFAAIALLIVLGGEPEEDYLPEPAREQVADAAPEGTAPTGATEERADEPGASVSEPSVTPQNAAPEFNVRPKDPDRDSSLRSLEELSSPSEDGALDDKVFFDAEIAQGEEFGIRFFQCAINEPTLIENLSVTKADFLIDGVVVALDELALREWDRGDKYCYFFEGVVAGLSIGSHVIENRYEQTETINDGFETYPPDSFSTVYRVDIFPAQTSSSTAEGSDQQGRRVRLHVGDARFFAVPPESVAYANTQHSTPPPEIIVMEDCGASCWRYNEWVALGEPGQYIEAQSAVSTSAIGVQLWGDDNDGWARVLVDGEEVWSGDMRGADNQWPGGAFVRYLEVNGLEPGVHKLRFEPIGEGGSVTVYFFGIGAVTP